MKKLKLLFIIPIFTLFSCNNNKVDLSEYSKEAQTAIKDFVSNYAH